MVLAILTLRNPTESHKWFFMGFDFILCDNIWFSLYQAHESVSAFAQAYSLGEKESAAAVNLLRKIPPIIKDSLTELVRTLALIYHGNMVTLIYQSV